MTLRGHLLIGAMPCRARNRARALQRRDGNGSVSAKPREQRVQGIAMCWFP
jgi:hypothetical protein